MRPGLPTPLTAAHDTSAFTCRHDSLSIWLNKRALANTASGASRTYVVCADDRRVVGYYALAAGSIAGDATPGRLSRNMRDPLPVIVLGRLAVHGDCLGRYRQRLAQGRGAAVDPGRGVDRRACAVVPRDRWRSQGVLPQARVHRISVGPPDGPDRATVVGRQSRQIVTH